MLSRARALYASVVASLDVVGHMKSIQYPLDRGGGVRQHFPCSLVESKSETIPTVIVVGHTSRGDFHSSFQYLLFSQQVFIKERLSKGCRNEKSAAVSTADELRLDLPSLIAPAPATWRI